MFWDGRGEHDDDVNEMLYRLILRCKEAEIRDFFRVNQVDLSTISHTKFGGPLSILAFRSNEPWVPVLMGEWLSDYDFPQETLKYAYNQSGRDARKISVLIHGGLDIDGPQILHRELFLLRMENIQALISGGADLNCKLRTENLDLNTMSKAWTGFTPLETAFHTYYELIFTIIERAQKLEDACAAISLLLENGASTEPTITLGKLLYQCKTGWSVDAKEFCVMISKRLPLLADSALMLYRFQREE